MFLVDWFCSILTSFGFMDKHAKLLFLGLDSAGKTTLLQMLKTNKLVATIPTGHPTMEELRMGNVVFTTFDLGGHQQARRLWRDYLHEVSGIVFVVDASAPERFAEAKIELDGLMDIEGMKEVPFLVLGNKIDISDAVSERKLREELGFEFTTGKGIVPIAKPRRPMELFMCSIKLRQGYVEGFRWLSQYV